MNNSKPGAKPGFVILVAPSGSYRVAPYITATKNLGYQILVVSNNEYSLVPDIAHGITVNFENQQQALSVVMSSLEDKLIKCVISTDDSVASFSAALNALLNLPGNATEVSRLTHRKDLARKKLSQAGCAVPDFEIFQISQLHSLWPKVDYPVVVKPLSLSGSRGVIRANNPEEFVEAVKRIQAILVKTGLKNEEASNVLIESYLAGNEYAVEGFVSNGEFILLTIFDKPEPLTGPFFEETYYVTPTNLDENLKNSLVAETKRCCKAYGIQQGPIHAEARLTDKGFVLLELAARTIGGQCGQLIEFSLDRKLEEIVIEGMCGDLPVMESNGKSAGVLMIPVTKSGILKRVEGITQAMQVPGIKDIEIHIQQGYSLVPLPEGSSYLGFIFAQTEDFASTYIALKKAFSCMNFVTSPQWEIELA